MSSMLWLAGVRYLLSRPWQTALSVLGITLGVAIVVAIDLGNQSAKHAFSLSSDAVTGAATHRIVGGPRRLAGAHIPRAACGTWHPRIRARRRRLRASD